MANSMSQDGMSAALDVSPEEFNEFLLRPLGLRVPALPLELLVRKRWRKLMLEGVDFIDKSAWLERAKACQASLGFPPDDCVAKAKQWQQCKAAPTLPQVPELHFEGPQAEQLGNIRLARQKSHQERHRKPCHVKRIGPQQVRPVRPVLRLRLLQAQLWLLERFWILKSGQLRQKKQEEEAAPQ